MQENVLSLAEKPADQFANIPVSGLSELEQESLVQLALLVLQERHKPGLLLDSAGASCNYLRLLLCERKNEVFGALFLDARHRILRVEELFEGTLSGASIYPRVVLQKAMKYNASAVIFFHNHPSGQPEPSGFDEAVTKKLMKVLSLVDVRVLDHIVVGHEGSVSFAERGLL